MAKFKSFAEVKRNLVIGSKWEAIFLGGEYAKNGEINMGVREVCRVQTNGVAFKTPRNTESWLYWDNTKSSDVVLGDDTFTINESGRPILRYNLIK